jgi:hypothetical protein
MKFFDNFIIDEVRGDMLYVSMFHALGGGTKSCFSLTIKMIISK